MAPRGLIAMTIFLLEFGCAYGEPYPCFASERILTSDRRFFAFAPANIRSEPPIECVFVFGGPPGSKLRLGLYDVKTNGPQVFLGQDSARLCGSDVIRVYDTERRGLQLRATYCGLLRRGKMLAMSSNMAVITYTSESNDPSNTFSLGVDAIDKSSELAQKSPMIPCPSTQPSTVVVDAFETATSATTAGDLDSGVRNSTATTTQNHDEYGDWNNSGDSESGEENTTSQEDSYGMISESSMPVATTPSPAEELTEGAIEVAVEHSEDPKLTSAEEGGRNFVDHDSELEGEAADKVATVISNGNGDEDEESKSYYYYL